MIHRGYRQYGKNTQQQHPDPVKRKITQGGLIQVQPAERCKCNVNGSEQYGYCFRQHLVPE
jgi:hypothetical protein